MSAGNAEDNGFEGGKPSSNPLAIEEMIEPVYDEGIQPFGKAVFQVYNSKGTQR
jgi:hypothetical protein